MTPSLHGELCQLVQKEGKRKLILMPRGSFKSSCVTIGYSIFSMLKNPNIRILIDSETFNNSKKFLHEIKGHLQSNQQFREIYGTLDQNREKEKWTESELIISTRAKNLKEPSVSTAGTDVVKVGMHYDLIIMDDPVSQLNITTKDQIEKIIEHYKLVLSLLEPTGELIIIGTRWHYSDLYGYLIEKEKDQFNILIKKAIHSDGNLLFPERLTKEFLNNQRKSQGSYIFSCQYQNEPIDDESAVFKKSQIKYYEKPPKNLTKYTTVDPAISQEKSGDYSGIVTCGVDPDNNLYVLETIREKLNPFELVNKIIETYLKWRPSQVGIETVSFQKAIQYFLKDEMKKRNIFIPLKELKSDTQITKEMRIKGLQPRFETGAVFIRKEMTDLEDELLRFPVGRHDDLIDALAYQLILIEEKKVRIFDEELLKPYL